MPIDFLSMNEKAIAEFRENEGQCGPPFEGTPIVLVTMIGAKSGRELCSPLAYSTDEEDLVIIASMGGAATNPNWYHNLVAKNVTVCTLPRLKNFLCFISTPRKQPRELSQYFVLCETPTRSFLHEIRGYGQPLR